MRAPQALVEPVSDALMDELEALSVSVADADAGTAGEQALSGEPGMPAPAAGWERSTLTALFDTARTGFDISPGLVGIMSLCLGTLKTGERAARMHLWARNSMSSVLVTGSVDVAHWHLVFVVVVVVRIDWSWWLMLAVLAEDDTVLRRLADGLLGSESLLSNRHE